MAIAAEQLAIVERRHLAEALGRHRLALDGDDGVGGDAGALAGLARGAAVNRERAFAQRPGHQVLGVVIAGLLPGDPAVRDLSLIHISEPTRLGMISYAVF